MDRYLRFVMGDSSYDIEVTFAKRRSITLRLEPGSNKIFIKAPIGISEDHILNLVAQKQRWIKKRHAELKDIEIQKREFIDGSTHLFLGEPFTLKVAEGKNNFSFENGILTITTKRNDPKNIEKLLYLWYSRQAQEIFPKIAATLITDFIVKHKVMAQQFEYKRVKSYWGQCVGQKYIRINIELIRARSSSIEMIFAHELCHLVHPNHSTRFYNLLENYHPQYQDEVKYLKNICLKY